MSNQFQGSLKKGAARVAAMLSSSSREKATAKKKSALENMRSWSAVVEVASCAWYSCAPGVMFRVGERKIARGGLVEGAVSGKEELKLTMGKAVVSLHPSAHREEEVERN